MEEKHIKKLYRSTTDKIFLGVCGGLGEYYEIDSNVVRLIFILLGLMTGPAAFIFYVLMAFLISNKPGTNDKKISEEIKEKAEEAVAISKDNEGTLKKSKNFFAIAIIVLGFSIILGQIIPIGFFFLKMIWPALIIALGVYLIIK